MRVYPFMFLIAACCLCSCGKDPGGDSPSDPEPGPSEPSDSGDPEEPSYNDPYTDEEYALMDDEEYIAKFQPITRFTIASDLHIHDSDGPTSSYYKRAVQLCTLSYSEAEKEGNSYSKLDGMLIAGDMVDNGKVTQYSKVKNIFDTNLKEGTTLITCTGNHDYWSDKANTITNYLSVFTDQKEDQMIKVGQFYVISMCASENNETATFDDKKQTWLYKQLRTASKATPGMPIFVMTHYAIFDTVYGSYNTHFGTEDLVDVLNQFPQVVYITGHSHFPIADPRSLYQGEFTCINTGTTAYSCHSINGLGLKDQSVYASDRYGTYVYKCPWVGDPYEIGDMQIIEVNRLGSVLIKGYDMLTNSQIFTRLVRYPADTTKFKTNEMKYEESIAPEFSAEASINFHEITSSTILAHIPASISTEYVESYRCEIYNSTGEQVNKSYLMADEFLFPNPELYILRASSLEADTDYTLKVYAVNAYSKESTKPLIKEFHTLSN